MVVITTGTVYVCVWRRLFMCMTVFMRVPVIMVGMIGVRSVFAVSAVFRLKGFVHRNHCHVHIAQHVGQYMVGFDFQMIGLQFNRHMAVSQVVGGTGQIEQAAVVRAMCDAQHRLRRGQHLEQRAVFAYQHIAAAHHLPALQEYADTAAAGVSGFEAAFLPHIPVQRDRGCAFEQGIGQTVALAYEFGVMNHERI